MYEHRERRQSRMPRTASFSLITGDLAPPMVPVDLDDEPLRHTVVKSPRAKAIEAVRSRYPEIDAEWVVDVVDGHLRA